MKEFTKELAPRGMSLMDKMTRMKKKFSFAEKIEVFAKVGISVTISRTTDEEMIKKGRNYTYTLECDKDSEYYKQLYFETLSQSVVSVADMTNSRKSVFNQEFRFALECLMSKKV
jgi:hypothetical protein